jgi:hypothetical protein
VTTSGAGFGGAPPVKEAAPNCGDAVLRLKLIRAPKTGVQLRNPSNLGSNANRAARKGSGRARAGVATIGRSGGSSSAPG